jgi:hypothetical protein
MSASDSAHRSTPASSALFALLAVAGCALWAVFVNGSEPVRAWRSLLINFLFFSALSGGLVVWLAVVSTCNGRWHLSVQRLAAAGIVCAVPSLAALILLWIGSPHWAPWFQRHFHQGAWLDNSFLFGRDLAALFIFWLMAAFYLVQRKSGPARAAGAYLIVVYSLSFSLLGFDLIMALDPGWYSNLAGGYFFMAGLYIGITFWALLATRASEARIDQRHDLGKLMVAFSLMTTYLMYANLLPFWYENLPHEVRFPIPRMHIPQWRAVSYLLIATVYFGPLVLLLTEWSKRNRLWLGAISLLVLVGMWIHSWWLIAPVFDPTPRLGMSEISAALAFIGLLGLGMDQFHARIPHSYLKEEK